MFQRTLNLALLAGIVVCLAGTWLLPADESRPNYDLMLEAQMAHSPAYDTFAPNANFADGMTLRTPPPGTIPRGEVPLHYEATPLDAARAGRELANPLPANHPGVRQRGASLFRTYCEICHGASGLGDGPLTRHGLPTPLSMLTGKAVQMKDGEMFHLLTYGQGNMPSHATQLPPGDRWCVIHYVRQMQTKRTVPSAVRLDETVKLFRSNCAACHGADGSGALMRAKYPNIPDFTSRAWQVSQTDLEIINRIEFGDMPHMPTFRYVLTRDQILALAAYIRIFAGTTASPELGLVTANMAPVQIFRNYCLACHNVDGRGEIVRKSFSDIPDFTSAAWHASKKDAELSQAILTGGKFMPPMKDKLSLADAEKMVRFIRGFEGGKFVVSLEVGELPPPVPMPADQAMRAVDAWSLVGQTQSGQSLGTGLAPYLLGAAVAVARAEPLGSPPELQEGERGASSKEVGRRVRAGAVIFRQWCIACHGSDGTGAPGRAAQLSRIPDFTSGAWQSDRSDPELLVSILDGKGTQMLANRGRVTEEQARDLVAYVRAFGPPIEGRLEASEWKRRFDALQWEYEAVEKQRWRSPLAPGKP
jgi:mono/diheme cytochrome c family protein